MDVVLAFAATLVSLRLAAELVRRWRTRRTPDLLVWGASLAAFAVASAALAWGAAAGWDDRAFRVYYLFGALLTAPLLGGGSLFRTRLSRTPVGAGGEIQLTDALKLMLDEGRPIVGVVLKARRHDIGNPADWLKTNLVFAWRDPALRAELAPLISALLGER